MCSRVVRGRGSDVTNYMGWGWRAVDPWGVASSGDRAPVGRRGEAWVVGRVMGEVVGVRRGRG